MECILIKDGILVSEGKEERGDIYIEDGIIQQCGQDLKLGSLLRHAEAITLDASGCYVFPGFIDAHTHLDMDAGNYHTIDDFDSGTRAALAGGTTSLIDFATQNKGETLQEALEIWHTKADNKSSCNYGFHMAITDWQPRYNLEGEENPQPNAGTGEQLQAICEQGVTSVKVYMAYDNLRLNDPAIFEILMRAKELGVLVGCHCENGDMVNKLIQERLAEGKRRPFAHPISRPPAIEAEAVSRFLALAQLAEVPVHIVHLSTKQGLDQVKLARKRGQKFFVETCPQYLVFTAAMYRRPGTEGAKFVCSPPFRAKQDARALLNELKRCQPDQEILSKKSTFIQTLATDHCSFNFKGQKDRVKNDFSKIPNGLPGLQHRPQVIFTTCNVAMDENEQLPSGSIRLSPAQFSALMGENSAKIFGLYPERGSLREGTVADITIWDPKVQDVITAEKSLHKVDYTPYEGMEVRGEARFVILGGELCAKQGKILKENKGKYLKRHAGFPK